MKLLSWGANTHSQLGYGKKSEQSVLPLEIPSDFIPADICSIIRIVGGGGHSLILDKYGNMYSCGWNSKGQLGHPIDLELLTFQRIILTKPYHITNIVCGWDSSMAVTQDGILLAWGSNAYGQLGFGKTEVPFTSTPLEVPVPKIQNMSMGLRHTALLTADGRVLTCGQGRKGQLGLLNTSGVQMSNSDKPIEVSGLIDVQSIACGQHHTVALTQTWQCFVWGDNKYGQLGLDPALHPMIHTPVQIDPFPGNGSPINCFLSTGWTHINLITENGNVINWGRNTYGQLGCHISQRPSTWQPQSIKNISNVKNLVTGSEHSLALLGNGQLFSWGWNEHGNCGIGTQDDVRTPTNILFNKGYKPVLIGAGAGHCFVIIE